MIAIVGIRGLLLDLIHFDKTNSPDNFEKFVEEKSAYLHSSRPTAINLGNALEIARKASKFNGTTQDKFNK